MNFAVTESSIRQFAQRRGYRVVKSRDRYQHANNRGLFMLLDDRDVVVFGADFDATIAQLRRYLDDKPLWR